MSQSYQYQSFDDAPGLVDSHAKLRALHLPLLVGKSFLDVGCNEGYYCGIALSAGANRVVGLDSFALAVERARRRFPGAEFVLQSWDHLPDESFDVILLASAMHYVESEEKIIALLTRIRQRLKPDGVFVLEAGISDQDGSALTEVERADGKVYYPTWEKFVNLINRAGFVWRKIAESEPGDGRARIVMHCRNILPVVMFVRGASMSGKSYLSNSLANYQYWRVLNLDGALAYAFRHYSPEFQIDESDWTTTLDRAIATLSIGTLTEIAGFVTAEITKKSEMVASENLPRQDPVVVDGFNEDHPASEIMFKHILSELHRRGYRVWDARPLSAPVADQWTMTEGLIDCGGFLLPACPERAIGDVLATNFDSEHLSCTLRVRLPIGTVVKGVSMHVFGSVHNGVIAHQHPGETFQVYFPTKPLYTDLGLNSVQMLVDALQRRDVHFSAWTNEHLAFYLNRPPCVEDGSAALAKFY